MAPFFYELTPQLFARAVRTLSETRPKETTEATNSVEATKEEAK